MPGTGWLGTCRCHAGHARHASWVRWGCELQEGLTGACHAVATAGAGPMGGFLSYAVLVAYQANCAKQHLHGSVLQGRTRGAGKAAYVFVLVVQPAPA